MLFNFEFRLAKLNFFLSVYAGTGAGASVGTCFYVACRAETYLDISCRKSVTFSTTLGSFTAGYWNLGKGGAFLFL